LQGKFIVSTCILHMVQASMVLSGRFFAILIVCLAVEHVLSVPITDFFVLGEGSFTTLGTTENAGCESRFTDFTVCGEILNKICVSFIYLVMVTI